MRKVPSRIAIASKDRGPIPILMLIDQLQRRLKIIRPHNPQNRPKDLLTIDPHLRLHMIEQTSPKKEPFASSQRMRTPINNQLSTFLSPKLNIPSHTLQMSLRHQRPQLRPSFIPSPTCSLSIRSSSLPIRASAVALPTVTATEIAMHRSPAEPYAAPTSASAA